MNDLVARRRYFAEEIAMVANLRHGALVEALAAVPRERFLPPGPWIVRGEYDSPTTVRQTPDADPRHVYHNVSIALDPARMLFNGAPGLMASTIDGLAPPRGGRVLHVGAGTGYFTALAAHCVGESGRVLALEVDGGLARRAASNLADMPWVEVREADGSGQLGERFDGILINAGVTHPLEGWLDALAAEGRMVLPLTATFAAMGPIGKGPMLLLRCTDNLHRLDVTTLTLAAIYSAQGIRDEAMNAEIGRALSRQPFARPAVLRRDVHDRVETCWIHGPSCCFSTA